jgi:hypothetical protein
MTYQSLDVLRSNEHANVEMPSLDEKTVQLRVPEHGRLVRDYIV